MTIRIATCSMCWGRDDVIEVRQGKEGQVIMQLCHPCVQELNKKLSMHRVLAEAGHVCGDAGPGVRGENPAVRRHKPHGVANVALSSSDAEPSDQSA